MYILCDTSTILLLIRISPDMFIDERYECCTLHEILDELFRTQKFKQRYPWRDKYKNKIKCLSKQRQDESVERIYHDAIKQKNDVGTVNNCTGRFFSLSKIDMKLLACALAHGFKLSTGDRGIKEFANQEFSDVFKGHASALDMINLWLGKKLTVWNDELHGYVMDWLAQNEHSQPKDQIRIFEKLTGRTYPS